MENWTAHDWIKAYQIHILEEGSRPQSVYAFAKKLDRTESQFYEHFASFGDLESRYWQSLVDRTRSRVGEEEVYKNYGARERLLYFYFTLFESLKEERSYLLWLLPNGLSKSNLHQARQMSKAIRPYLKEIVATGKETQEIVDRPFLSDRYNHLLSGQLPWLVSFWLRDTSKGFEKTDAAIEKSVHLAFDLMDKNPLDSMFDFTKFVWQNQTA